MPKLYRSVANATVDANGNASFSFEQIPMGFVWMGSITIPGTISSSVTNILWTATDLGVAGTALGYPIANWWNAQSSGTVQAVNRINVTGSGLAAGTLQAFFQGYVYSSQEIPPPWWPEPTPAPPPSSPQILTALTGSTVVGTSLTLVGSATVIVGTSISMYLSVSAATRVLFQWNTPPPSALAVETFQFDVRGGGNLNGLVLPNVGPLLQLFTQANAAGTTVTSQIFTGLPPITQSPVPLSNVLWSASGTVGANLQVVIPLIPYFGPCSFMMSPNNVPGFQIYIQPSDYQGNNQALIRNTQGWAAGTGPFSTQGIVYIPAQINTVVVDNSAVGSPTNYVTSGIALGP